MRKKTGEFTLEDLKEGIWKAINKWYNEITNSDGGCIAKSIDLGNRYDIQAVDMYLFEKSLVSLREWIIGEILELSYRE